MMKSAQIEITDYFVSDLQFTANSEHDTNKPSKSSIEDIQITNQADQIGDPRSWQITQRIAINAPSDRNAPYSFLLEIIGFIHVADSVVETNIERFVRINGASLVFSAAREIIRSATARGPYKSILLPTVTFWEPKPEIKAETPSLEQTVDTPETNAQQPSV
jgi:preprotein translocase subunit SecB